MVDCGAYCCPEWCQSGLMRDMHAGEALHKAWWHSLATPGRQGGTTQNGNIGKNV